MDDYKAFTKALIYAAEKHRHQMRKDGSPYIYHPIAVAQLVHTAGHGLKYQIVALLHDVLEDTSATEEEIAIFGDEILQAVKAISREENESNEDYVDKLLRNKIAKTIKSCDVVHNMFDTLLCDDREWVRLYVVKTRRLYRGKLSKAADMAIDMAIRYIDDCPEVRPTPSFTKEELAIYSNFDSEY